MRFLLACLFLSCRNNGINFFDYLSDVLNKAATLPSGSPAEAYRDLLPDKWTKNEQVDAETLTSNRFEKAKNRQFFGKTIDF